MAGLFDFLRDNPAITQGLLAGGFGAMAGRGSKLQAWGQGGLAGLQGYSNALNSQSQEQDRALAAKRAAIQEQMLQMQLENAQRQQQGQKATQDYLTQALSPAQPIDANAMSGIAGPRPEALQGVGKVPGFDTAAALRAGVPVETLPQIQQMLAPKAADYKVVGDSLVKIGPDGVSPVFRSAPKPEKPSLFYKDPETGKTMVDPVVLDVERTMAQLRRPVNNVSVNTDNLGLKPKERFEMEGKLGDDYRTAIKSDQTILSSVGKIRDLVDSGSPLKDQSAIYSFAKMLDPEGAVREADYAAIAGAAGGVDRLKNILKRAVTGEMLTETQRKDMVAAASLFEKKAYERIARANKKYGDQAKRYNLDPSAFSIEVPGVTVDFEDMK